MTTLNDLYGAYGQSPWIDNIRRDWLNDGTLADLVAKGVRGVTSNPSIFAKALATSDAYDAFVNNTGDDDPEKVFERLAVADVQDACDVLKAVYESSAIEFSTAQRRYMDGFVSLEVSPRLARDTSGTIAAANRLFKEVNRNNVMIKIPATREGLPAIREVLGAGINVNVTLIFSLERYEEVLTAWMDGLAMAHREGHNVSQIASVASFFVSRVDVAVDSLLPEGDARRGATANAQVAGAYQIYRDRIVSERAVELLALGAQVQRPLWASTSTKNPTYYDLLYVDNIVANETVNTMPDATLAGVLNHGNFSHSLLANDKTIEEATKHLQLLPSNVSLLDVTNTLEEDGVQAFVDSYEELLATVAKKIAISK